MTKPWGPFWLNSSLPHPAYSLCHQFVRPRRKGQCSQVGAEGEGNQDHSGTRLRKCPQHTGPRVRSSSLFHGPGVSIAPSLPRSDRCCAGCGLGRWASPAQRGHRGRHPASGSLSGTGDAGREHCGARGRRALPASQGPSGVQPGVHDLGLGCGRLSSPLLRSQRGQSRCPGPGPPGQARQVAREEPVLSGCRWRGSARRAPAPPAGCRLPPARGRP